MGVLQSGVGGQSDFLAEPLQQLLEPLGLAQAVEIAIGLILLTVGETGVDRFLQIIERFFLLRRQREGASQVVEVQRRAASHLDRLLQVFDRLRELSEVNLARPQTMPRYCIVRFLFDQSLISRRRFGPFLRLVMRLSFSRQIFLRLRRQMLGSWWKRADDIHHDAPLPLCVALPDAREIALLRLLSTQLVTAVGIAQIAGA